MQLTNFCVTPMRFAAGDAINIAFVLARGANEAQVRGVRVTCGLGNHVFCEDADFTLAPGAEKRVSLFTVATASSFSAEVGGEIAQNFWTVELNTRDGAAREEINLTYETVYCDPAYRPPRIAAFELRRATAGQPDDGGVQLLADVELELPDAGVTAQTRLRLYYGSGASVDESCPYIDLTAKLPQLFKTPATADAALVAETFSAGSEWRMMLVLSDGYRAARACCTLPRAFANLHLSGASTGGAAFGRFSGAVDGSPRLESDYPAYFYGGITNLQSGMTDAVNVSSGAICDHVIAFERPFAAGTVPRVLVCFASASTSGNFGRCTVGVPRSTVTANGFTARVYNGDASGRMPGVIWLAIGQPGA